MKFAYLILVHHYPFQLEELVNQLQDGENYFFIHVDNKVDQKLFQKQQYSVPENVFFCEKRVNVNWGGFSQVLATLQLIRDLIQKNIRCEYVHLISGQDFPIKTNEYIKKFFEQSLGKNYIKYYPLPFKHWYFGGLDRISYKWMIDELGLKKAKAQVTIQNMENETLPFPEGYSPYGGSQWWSLTYECVEYLAGMCNPGHILYDFYKTTKIPDEMYFQTLLLHSEFKDTIENTNLHYIDWNSGPEYPRILRMEDFDKLKQSKDLFARKFNDFVDYRVRQALKNEILAKSGI